MRRLSVLLMCFSITLATLAPTAVSAAPASVTVSGSVFSPLQVIGYSAAGGPGNLRDWVGVYAVDSPDVAFLSWEYLSGQHTPPPSPRTGINDFLEAPAIAGTYEVRFYADDGYSLLARSSPFTVTTSLMRIDPAAFVVGAGQPLPVNVSGGPGRPHDRVALVPQNAPPQALVDWKYLNDSRVAPATGRTAATVTLTAPTTPGFYFADLLLDGGYTRLVRSARITVVASAPVQLRASSDADGGGARVLVGGGARVTISFNGAPAGRLDWVGMYRGTDFYGDALATDFLDWKYTNDSKVAPTAGRTSGSVTFTIPENSKEYQFRFFTNDGFTESGQRAWVQSGVPVLHASALAVSPGQRVALTTMASLGHTTDWIGLYLAGSPDTDFLDWQYLSGTRNPPVVPLYSATNTFTMPTVPGTYQFRLFTSDGFSRITVSQTVTVS